MARAYLGLGANLGDSVSTINAAFLELSRFLANPRLSRLWSSKAMYVEDQPDFVNAVAMGETELGPRELLAAINAIEARFGRDRGREVKKGPRPLDIDILLYGDALLREPDLVIPHAALRERRFALEPLLDLEPELVDPESGVKFSTIVETLPPQGIYLIG
jgi:2-amino-4-hydroxy-6-hydroxymethyldihydropteridine diphosphokinase